MRHPPPECFIGCLVLVLPGFPLNACGNDLLPLPAVGSSESSISTSRVLRKGSEWFEGLTMNGKTSIKPQHLRSSLAATSKDSERVSATPPSGPGSAKDSRHIVFRAFIDIISMADQKPFQIQIHCNQTLHGFIRGLGIEGQIGRRDHEMLTSTNDRVAGDHRFDARQVQADVSRSVTGCVQNVNAAAVRQLLAPFHDMLDVTAGRLLYRRHV